MKTVFTIVLVLLSAAVGYYAGVRQRGSNDAIVIARAEELRKGYIRVVNASGEPLKFMIFREGDPCPKGIFCLVLPNNGGMDYPLGMFK